MSVDQTKAYEKDKVTKLASELSEKPRKLYQKLNAALTEKQTVKHNRTRSPLKEVNHYRKSPCC